MRNLPFALILASTLSATASPAWARSGVAIDFSYRSKELVSEQGRENLLERMKTRTRAVCSGDLSKAYSTPERCEIDLEKQFVKAIGHPLLIAQYRGESVKIARNGSQTN